MTRIETYPPGVPCFVDALSRDVDAARRFYAGIFGWEFSGPGPMPGGPDAEYWVARVRGHDVAGLGTCPADDVPQMWNTHVAVADVDAAADAVRAAAGRIVAAPFDVPPAGRMAVIADPSDAVLTLWQARQRAGAQLVNEPSAWAMSLLTTPRPEQAAAFYAAVFGWRAEPFGDDGSGLYLFRLPGYVGGEPGQPVPRDVVAAMSTAPAEERDGYPPVHWSVDFWVADADGGAARAPQFGGAVVAGAYDVPTFRQAVLAAPDGATFTISELRVPGGDSGGNVTSGWA